MNGIVEGISQGINAGTEAVGNALGLFDDLFKRVDSVRKRGLGTQACLRAYYLEVVNNLEMLTVVNARRFAGEKVNAPLVKSLVSRLETSVGAAILFGEEPDRDSELYRFLATNGRLSNRQGLLVRSSGLGEERVKGSTCYENVLQAISFTVVKLEVLRRLTAFGDEELAMLNNVMLQRRIVNIHERFALIKTALDGLKGIREMSR